MSRASSIVRTQGVTSTSPAGSASVTICISAYCCEACYQDGRWAVAKKVLRGFEANARKIARERGISIDRARAILAEGARKASEKAKRANPRLRRVKGA